MLSYDIVPLLTHTLLALPLALDNKYTYDLNEGIVPVQR
jgi:hypothetical protein